MTETNSFKLGDSVWLNSGSPPLTVVQLHDNGRVTVTWSEDGQPKEETYAQAAETSLALYLAKFDSDRTIAS